MSITVKVNDTNIEAAVQFIADNKNENIHLSLDVSTSGILKIFNVLNEQKNKNVISMRFESIPEMTDLNAWWGSLTWCLETYPFPLLKSLIIDNGDIHPNVIIFLITALRNRAGKKDEGFTGIDHVQFGPNTKLLRTYNDTLSHFENNPPIKQLHIENSEPEMVHTLLKHFRANTELLSLTLVNKYMPTHNFSNKGYTREVITKALADFLRTNTTLTSLNFALPKIERQSQEYRDNKTLDDDLVVSLSDYLLQNANTALTDLSLSYYLITDKAACQLAKVLRQRPITALDLSSNRITDTGATELARTPLLKLNLDFNSITSVCVPEFAANAHLLDLKLSSWPRVFDTDPSLAIQRVEANKHRLREWERIWLLIAFIRANQNHTFRYSVIPLLSTVLDHIDSVPKMSVVIMEDLLRKRYMREWLEFEKFTPKKELKVEDSHWSMPTHSVWSVEWKPKLKIKDLKLNGHTVYPLLQKIEFCFQQTEDGLLSLQGKSQLKFEIKFHFVTHHKLHRIINRRQQTSLCFFDFLEKESTSKDSKEKGVKDSKDSQNEFDEIEAFRILLSSNTDIFYFGYRESGDHTYTFVCDSEKDFMSYLSNLVGLGLLPAECAELSLEKLFGVVMKDNRVMTAAAAPASPRLLSAPQAMFQTAASAVSTSTSAASASATHQSSQP